jgi:hypothetical protein
MSENFSPSEEVLTNSNAAPQQSAIIVQRRGAGTGEKNSTVNSNRPAPHASSSVVKISKKPSARPALRSTMTLRVRRQNVSYAKFDQSDEDGSEYDRHGDYEHDNASDNDDDEEEQDDKREATDYTSLRKKHVRARTASVDTEPSEIDPPESHDHDDGSTMIDRRASDGYANAGFVECVHIHCVRSADDADDDHSCSTLSHHGGDDCYTISENDDVSGQQTPEEIDMESLDLTVVGRSYGIVVASLEEAYAMSNPTPASDALIDSFLA